MQKPVKGKLLSLRDSCADKFFGRHLDFRVRVFNMLGMAGIGVSIFSSVSSIGNREGMVSVSFNIITAFVAYGLMCYASRSGRYQLCYMLSIGAIFLVCFTFIFFTGGGYYGAMPFFFIFAVVFTVYMLEGKKAVVMAGAELVFYTGLCLFAYFFPGRISVIERESYKLLEILAGFWAVSIMLGITMIQQFRLYHEQQQELEAGREEALQLSEAKSSFLASVSHEIRTPINVMLGMNEMVLRESGSESVREYGKNIQNAGKTLLLLINNILDVSKIESGKLELLEESYRTEVLIDELSVIGAELASRHGLEFQTEADEALPGGLTGDWVHLKQVAVNFLSNAAKYTRQGSVTLRFSGRPGDGADSFLLHISVEDTGIGIRKEHIPVLFDAFTRVDISANRSVEGTGLGLAIAKELTELMGGSIHVESRWGEGSIFSVEVPQRVADPVPLGRNVHMDFQEPERQKNGFVAPGAAVLVVDDNEENLKVMRALLSRTMLHVDTVRSGAQALEAAGRFKYDVILMDYMMPGMDGEETLLHLRELPGFHTPAVALTANVVAGVREKLLDAGFCRYLSKPVMWRELEAVLRELLPAKLVTEGREAGRAAVSGAEKDALAAELLPYGITMGRGLDYLGGDIFQYRKLACFFEESFLSGKADFHELISREDWESLKYKVHSLKSQARAVGAEGLSSTAEKLERLCAEGNGSYIGAMLPLLDYEWERAREGLEVLCLRLKALSTRECRRDAAPLPGLEDLAKLLDHHRHPDALEALDRFIAMAQEPETAAQLREIWKKVDEVEFEQAQHMLSCMMGGSDNG